MYDKLEILHSNYKNLIISHRIPIHIQKKKTLIRELAAEKEPSAATRKNYIIYHKITIFISHLINPSSCPVGRSSYNAYTHSLITISYIHIYTFYIYNDIRIILSAALPRHICETLNCTRKIHKLRTGSGHKKKKFTAAA